MVPIINLTRHIIYFCLTFTSDVNYSNELQLFTFSYISRIIWNMYSLFTLLFNVCVHPNQELSWAKSELQGKWWAYVSFLRGAANHPIILQYKVSKCAYLCMYSK